MKNNRVKRFTRIALIICGVVLCAALIVPIWRIELNAPQYPEGLTLLIYANRLGGSVDIINGLNHYIGMKTLHANDFAEFVVLPYIIAFFAISFIAAGLFAKKNLLYTLFVLFVIFGVLAMIDFWRWEYDYGHNLNPDAAIVVPGMAYQPPLIGFKQLLNFGAYSVPDIGGWIFVAAGTILLILVIIERRLNGKNLISNGSIKMTVVLFIVTAMVSCNAGPEPITIGTDNCTFCKMTISDARFGAEIVTKKGKVFKFDDAHCIVSFIQTKQLPQSDINNIYFTNFSNGHSLIKVKEALLFKSDALHSPMGGNVAAFNQQDSIKIIQQQYNGIAISWNELNKQ
jgi:copper chaperone NosL